MRILPPYWITLVLTLLACLTTGLLWHQWLLLTPYTSHPLAQNGTTGFLLAAASNLTLIGQDWIMFLSHDSGQGIGLTANFWNDKNPLWHYLLIPQCWSVGVELAFYAFAPYLNRLRSRWLTLVAIFALGSRLLTYLYMGEARDPWTYRFFPFECSLFILGMLGYRLYSKTTPYHHHCRLRCVSRLSYVLGSVSLLLFFNLEARATGYAGRLLGQETSMLLSYLLWALLIPVLFFAFGNQKDDRKIGELSYPIYLVHFIVIAVTTLILSFFGIERIRVSLVHK